MRYVIVFNLMIFYLVFFVGEESFAQSLSGMNISLEAHNKFEWRRKEQFYIAEGSVLLKRGGATIGAERVLVYYNEQRIQEEGSRDEMSFRHQPEIYRLVMEKGVLISSTEGQMSARKAVYDSESQVLVATGSDDKPVRVEFSDNRVITSDEVSYWIEDRRLVGSGNIAISGFGINFRSDKASVFFIGDEEGDIVIPGSWSRDGVERMKLDRVEVTGNVLFTFDGGQMRGRDGMLSWLEQEAEICGEVNAQWLDISFSGDCINIDLKNHRVQFFDTKRELDGVRIQIPMSRVREFVK